MKTNNNAAEPGRSAFIAGLRVFADWIESHPGAPLPFSQDFVRLAYTKEEFLEWRRASGLTEKSEYGSEHLAFRKTFTPPLSYPWIRYHLVIEKQKTCQQVQVGTRVVPAEPEKIIPATPAREEPILEWQCDEPLLAEAPVAAATEER